MSLPELRYPSGDKTIAAIEEIERRLRQSPGVEVVGASSKLPLRGYVYTSDATPDGRAAGDYERELRFNFATPDYFKAMGVPLLTGRTFTDADRPGNAPVTIVNRTLERLYFRGQPALGKRIKFGRPQDDEPWTTIVGVVADQRQDSLEQAVRPEAFTPMRQEPRNGVTFVVRGAVSTETLVGAARQTVRAYDPELAVTDVAPLAELVRASLGDQRFRTVLLLAFALIALFLAALGVYGVLAYAVARRTREIGVRLALGAPRGRLFTMVLRDGIRPVLFGIALGLPLAYGGASLGRSLLFGVAPADPLTYAVTVAVLGTVALGACALPAARALRVDPLVCLRDE